MCNSFFKFKQNLDRHARNGRACKQAQLAGPEASAERIGPILPSYGRPRGAAGGQKRKAESPKKRAGSSTAGQTVEAAQTSATSTAEPIKTEPLIIVEAAQTSVTSSAEPMQAEPAAISHEQFKIEVDFPETQPGTTLKNLVNIQKLSL